MRQSTRYRFIPNSPLCPFALILFPCSPQVSLPDNPIHFHGLSYQLHTNKNQDPQTKTLLLLSDIFTQLTLFPPTTPQPVPLSTNPSNLIIGQTMTITSEKHAHSSTPVYIYYIHLNYCSHLLRISVPPVSISLSATHSPCSHLRRSKNFYLLTILPLKKVWQPAFACGTVSSWACSTLNIRLRLFPLLFPRSQCKEHSVSFSRWHLHLPLLSTFALVGYVLSNAPPATYPSTHLPMYSSNATDCTSFALLNKFLKTYYSFTWICI